MLTLLFVLATISLIILFVLPIIQKRGLTSVNTLLYLVQAGCIGAIFGLLAVLVIKGASLG